MSGQTAAIQQQEVPPPGSNDLKEQRVQCTHDVVAKPEVKVAANQGCNDNTSPSKSPNKKVEKSPDKTVEGKPKKLSSSNPSAEQPKQQPSPPHKDACAGDAKVADTASPASAKKEKKEHPAATRVASAVEPRDATKSPTHTATKNAPPAADVAGAETPTKAVDTTKKQVDATAAAQEQSNKEGGSEQSPSSPSKKKKKSKSKNKKVSVCHSFPFALL